jgi:hypothetical protein
MWPGDRRTDRIPLASGSTINTIALVAHDNCTADLIEWAGYTVLISPPAISLP